MKAIEYEILRDIKACGRTRIPLERKPLRVATLLNEQKFLANGGLMKHNDTVFFEDQSHDWNWKDGSFSYYTRVAERADVLVVYETAD